MNDESYCQIWIKNDYPYISFQESISYYLVDGREPMFPPKHQLHRLNGPAVIWKNGTKEWYVNGQRHRLNGAAVEHYNGKKEWWINNEKLPTEEVKAWIEQNKINLKKKTHQIAFKLRWM